MPSGVLSPKNPLPNSHFLNPVPQHLRALVLDYLFQNCYTSTARALIKDSSVRHLDADGDEIMDSTAPGHDDSLSLHEETLQLLQLRKEIQLHLLSGRINEATTMLNSHFPSVLSSEPQVPRQQAAYSDMDQYVYAQVLDPTHLSLNLRIQAFIEDARTIPLPYQPNPSSETISLEPTTDSILRIDSDAHKAELIQFARKLNAAVKSLESPADRIRYTDELKNVASLLAYAVPERSPVAKYLTRERREAVAEQINSAILYRTEHRSISQVELSTRYTSVLWSFLHDMKVKPPPEASRPPGVHLPTRERMLTSKPAASDKEAVELVPSFDLQEFLSSKTR